MRVHVFVLFLALLLVPVVVADTPSAQVYTTTFGGQTNLEKDYTQQAIGVFGSVSGPACNVNSVTHLNLTGGSTYYVLMGAVGASTLTLVGNATGSVYSFATSNPHAITVLNSAWAPVAIWGETGASTTGNAFVRITPTTSDSVYFTCTGSAARSTFTNGTASTLVGRRMGFYDYLWTTTSPVPVAAIYNATLTQLDEVGILNSQLRYDNLPETANCPETITPGGNRVYFHNLTRSDGGRASYVFIQEFLNTSVDGYDYTVSSTKGGTAIPIDVAAGSGSPNWRLTAWRLWYTTPQYNTSETNSITIGLSSVGASNTFRVCKFEAASSGIPNTGQFDSPNAETFLPPLQSSIHFTQLWSSDDYNTTLNVVVKECLGQIQTLSGMVSCTSVGSPIEDATVWALLTPVPSTTTDENGEASLTRQDLGLTAFALRVSKGGFSTKTYTIDIDPGSTTIDLYLKRSAGVSGFVSAECYIVVPDPGNFSVPAAANFTVSQECGKSDVYYSIFQRQSNGELSLITPVNLLVSFNTTYNVTWPSRGYTTNTTFDDNVGSYALVLSNSTAHIQKAVAFIIRDGDSTPAQVNVNDSGNLGNMQNQLSPAQAEAVSNQATTENRNFIQGATTAMFSSPLGIPNMWLILIILAIFGLIYGRRK